MQTPFHALFLVGLLAAAPGLAQETAAPEVAASEADPQASDAGPGIDLSTLMITAPWPRPLPSVQWAPPLLLHWPVIAAQHCRIGLHLAVA